MTQYTRRDFLRASAPTTAVLISGCISGRDGSLHLQSLDVSGSPGGRVPVAPSGMVSLLDFFATWCAPCKPQMRHLRAVRERFGTDEVSMLSITTENDRGAVGSFWERYDGTWPVALDPELKATQQFNVRRIPTLLVLSSTATETWRHVGLADTKTIGAKIEAAMNEK